jgi:hypothetical protein
MPIGFVPPSGQNTTIKVESGASRSDLENLLNRFEKLKLVTMAMWTFLKDEKGLTEEALMERVREIDRLDGSEDGKIRLGVKKCGKCGRTLNPKFEKCLYCGAVTPAGTVFETF